MPALRRIQITSLRGGTHAIGVISATPHAGYNPDAALFVGGAHWAFPHLWRARDGRELIFMRLSALGGTRDRGARANFLLPLESAAHDIGRRFRSLPGGLGGLFVVLVIA